MTIAFDVCEYALFEFAIFPYPLSGLSVLTHRQVLPLPWLKLIAQEIFDVKVKKKILYLKE